MKKCKKQIANDIYKYDLGNRFLNACWNGNLILVKELISKGANIHINDDIALAYATDGGYLDTVKFLIENGIRNYARALELTNNVKIKKYLEGIILIEKRKKYWKKANIKKDIL